MIAQQSVRALTVFVPGWVLDDRPPARGDVIDVVLSFQSAGPTPLPWDQTVRVTVRPMFGHTPSASTAGGLRWPVELLGDGWSAEWLSDRPLAGRVELTGRLTIGIRWRWADPAPVQGRVRRVQIVEQRVQHTDRGLRAVDGTERLTEVDATPHRFWSDWDMTSNEDHFQATGVLVDLALDDVPDATEEFVAGAVSVDGPDVWVMDRSNPVLLHLDMGSTPPRVVEYLLPLTIEPPVGQWTRRVHADRGGCWITSQYEVFRCDRADDGTLTIERVSVEGGRTVLVDGRLFLVGRMVPNLSDAPRYGVVRSEGDIHLLRVLDEERRFVPVADPAIVVRVRAQPRRVDLARGADGTEWVAGGGLTAQSSDGARRRVGLDARTCGVVRWIQPDPYADPANADIMARIAFPPPRDQKSDEGGAGEASDGDEGEDL